MFLHFTQIQDGRQEMAEKRFLVKNASRLCNYPAGQTFRQNRSISHSLQEKCIFEFYAGIQDGRQKWRENDSW